MIPLKVSFCTTCMGRLEHLKETLPKNIEDNKDYPYVEFVILDYNSQDGLKEWIEQTYADEIKSGLIRYVQTIEPKHFNMTHAKNMAHRVATGDILVNVDADNFIGEGFAFWLNKQFSENPDIICRPDRKFRNKPEFYGSAGRIAISHKNFYELRGYKENFEGWGVEDGDFTDRAKNAGLQWIGIPEAFVINPIQHDNSMRVENYSENVQKMSQTRLDDSGSLHSKVVRFVERATTRIRPEIVNIKGNCGCGEVYINFEETPQTIEPLQPVDRINKLNNSAAKVYSR